MMECRYYSPTIRCYSDGRIERLKGTNQYDKNPKWVEVGQTCISNGYLRIRINKKTVSWHRVIWESFNGTIPDGMTVNHIDECRTNNSICNLELMTIGDNIRYSQSKRVIGINVENGYVIEFSSTMEAGRNGFDQSDVASCCRGEYGCKTHKGYRWFYVE